MTTGCNEAHIYHVYLIYGEYYYLYEIAMISLLHIVPSIVLIINKPNFFHNTKIVLDLIYLEKMTHLEF